MKDINRLYVPKAGLITGFAAWLSISVINHFFDYGTYLKILTDMFKMTVANPNVGKGLVGRAISNPLMAQISYDIIILYQCFTVVLLWRAAIGYLKLYKNDDSQVYSDTLIKSNIALGAMMIMWFLFIFVGIMWGYWLSMEPVLENHLIFLVLTVVSIVFMNFDSHLIKKHQ